MNLTPAERSAEQFGVKLRRVMPSASDEHDGKGSRRSLPSLGPPTRCEARAVLRRTAATSQPSRSDSKQAQVALRQEAAERQAIERQKRLSSEKTPLSATKSRSWEKPSRPSIAHKSHARNISATSSSMSKCLPSATSSTLRPTNLQGKPSITRQSSVEITIQDESSSTNSWYSRVLQSFHEYKPMLDSLLNRVTQVVHHQSEYTLLIYPTFTYIVATYCMYSISLLAVACRRPAMLV